MIKHGCSLRGKITIEYHVWNTMKQKCFNENHARYEDYGGRGIVVCDRWMEFANFISDMGKRPGKGYSIERRDNDGNYEKDNCYWATPRQQAQNRRSTVWVELNGDRIALAEA